jgi:hypothetical protein
VVPEEVYKTGKNGQIGQIGKNRTKTHKKVYIRVADDNALAGAAPQPALR